MYVCIYIIHIYICIYIICCQAIINKIKTLEQTPAVLKNRSSNLPDGSVPKSPGQSQTYQHYLKIPKLVPTTGKHQKFANIKSKNLKKILEHSTKPCGIEK